MKKNILASLSVVSLASLVGCGTPDGGANAVLTTGAAAIEGTIDNRDTDVTSFDAAGNPNRNGDQYKFTTAATTAVKIGVNARSFDNRSNIVDYVIEAQPTANPFMQYIYRDGSGTGGNECMSLSAATVPTSWTPFPAGEWNIRVLSYRTLPTDSDLANATSLYRIKVEMGDSGSCTFDP